MSMTKLIAAAKTLRDRSTLAYLKVQNFLTRKEEGATMAEYALLVGLIALVAIVGVALVGTALSGTFSNIANKVKF